MGKKSWSMLLVVTLLLAAGFVFSKTRAQHEPVARIALPDGTELRLEYVTYGTEHRIPGAGRVVAWASQFTGFLPGARSYCPEYTHRSTAPCPALWFTRFDPQSGKFMQNPDSGLGVEIAGDGQGASLPGGSGNEALPMPNVAYEVASYDRRKPDFRVRVTMQNQTSELVVPNPVAGATFPVWQPEPLPQTRRVGSREYVLTEIKCSRDEQGHLLHANPQFKVLEDGKDVNRVISGGWELMDATGNIGSVLPLGEPAWKVRGRFRRTGDYPFAAGEGLTVGPVEMPGPGAFVEFAVPSEEARNGLRHVLLVGPGHFVWQDGVFVTAETVSSTVPTGTRSSRGPGKHSRREFTTAQPLLIFVFEGRPTDRWLKSGPRAVVRAHLEGRSVGLLQTSGGGGGSADFEQRSSDYTFPPGKRDNAITLTGPISIQIVPAEPETVEFLVAPPKLPELPR